MSKNKRKMKFIEVVPEEILQEASFHFQKKFSFQQSGVIKIPCNDRIWMSEEWEIDYLQQMKIDLNESKNQLNDKHLEQWAKHTSFTNPTYSLIKELKQKFNPELCTQAWIKFYEILSNYDELYAFKDLCSVHLCEAPGAFVTALNHFLKTKHPEKEWDWIATTLNPYFEGNSQGYMIADDRLIIQSLCHWDFGDDRTGDITNPDNLEHLINRTEKWGPVNLVTADGSIDCTDQPSDQEKCVSWLQYCEIVTALHLLVPSGNFVIKMFTFFEQQSVNLLYLLNCVFHQVHVFKPGASKSGNSECYVICCNYVGKENISDCLRKLKEFMANPPINKSLFYKEDLHNSFLTQLAACATIFKNYQEFMINYNIRTFPVLDPIEITRLKQLHKACVEHFIIEFDLKPITPKDQLVGANKIPFSPVQKVIRNWTFNEKQAVCSLPWQQRLEYLQNFLATLKTYNISPELNSSKMKLNHYLKMDSLDSSNFIWGKRIKRVVSSKFCDQQLLNVWKEIGVTSMLTKEVKNVSFLNYIPCIKELQKSINSNWFCDITGCVSSLPVEVSTHFKFINSSAIISSSCKLCRCSQEENSCSDLDVHHKEKHQWISCLVLASEEVQADDNMIMMTGFILTRFFVTCLFLLCHMFESVRVIDLCYASGQTISGQLIVATKRYKDLPKHLNTFLKEASLQLAEEDLTKELLELISISNLLEDKPFSFSVTQFNELRLSHQIRRRIDQEIMTQTSSNY